MKLGKRSRENSEQSLIIVVEDYSGNLKRMPKLNNLACLIESRILNNYRGLLSIDQLADCIQKYRGRNISTTINTLISQGVLCKVSFSDKCDIESDDCVVFFTRAYMEMRYKNQQYNCNWLMHKVLVATYLGIKESKTEAKLSLTLPSQYDWLIDQFIDRVPLKIPNITTVEISTLGEFKTITRNAIDLSETPSVAKKIDADGRNNATQQNGKNGVHNKNGRRLGLLDRRLPELSEEQMHEILRQAEITRAEYNVHDVNKFNNV